MRRVQRSRLSVLVVDASVVAAALVDGTTGDGGGARDRMRGEALAAPDLIISEVLSVIRRRLRERALSTSLANGAVDALSSFPVELFPTRPFAQRVWELRDNVTAYDGCYVALAEALDCPLLTGDRRLARAPVITCTVETI